MLRWKREKEREKDRDANRYASSPFIDSAACCCTPRYVHARGPLPSVSQGAEPVNIVTLSWAFRRERSPSFTSSCAIRPDCCINLDSKKPTPEISAWGTDDRWRWKFFGVCKWKQAPSWSQVSVRKRLRTDVTRVICIVYFGDWVGRQIFITRFESLEYFLCFNSVFIICFYFTFLENVLWNIYFICYCMYI